MQMRYGTARPTRQDVEEKTTSEVDQIEGQCWYHVVYEGDSPSEWYFEGCSDFYGISDE